MTTGAVGLEKNCHIFRKRTGPTNLCDGAQMAMFCILYFIISEPRSTHFRPAFQIRTKAHRHHVW